MTTRPMERDDARARAPGQPTPPPKAQRRSRKVLRYALWLAAAAGALVLLGIYLGVEHPDAWYTRLARWLGRLLF